MTIPFLKKERFFSVCRRGLAIGSGLWYNEKRSTVESGCARIRPKGKSMTLIIAEKPSLARNIVAGIEQMTNQKMTRRDGYFEGCGYLVSWAFGHLFSLCDIEAYLPPEKASSRWNGPVQALLSNVLPGTMLRH